MITSIKAHQKIDDMKNIDFALKSDTKGEIRKVIISKLEKHLFEIDCDCPKKYLIKIDAENNKDFKSKFLFKF